MPSTSAADYKLHCRQLIEAALQRPRMYFTTLRELELLLRGHEAAFAQLDVIDGNHAFHASFGAWLHQSKQVSASGGWSHAIELLAESTSNDADAIFAGAVRQFLTEWLDEAMQAPSDP